ncbi:MAG: hypothetical protein QXO70_02980 [Candidatus Pacearchaeota archaeon]
MKTADIAKLTLEELKKRVEFCEKEKQKLINYLQDLKDKFLEKKLTYEEYEKIYNSPYEGKNIQEWFDYYENYVKDCKERIKVLERKILSKKVFSVFVWSAVFISVFLAFFYASPTLIGLVIQTQTQEFYQQINQNFIESTDYQIKLENPGKIISLKISGSIEGGENSKVKVYLDELLVIDSDKLYEKQPEKQTKEKKKGIGITGMAIGEKKSSLVSIPETEQPQTSTEKQPSQKEPISEEQQEISKEEQTSNEQELVEESSEESEKQPNQEEPVSETQAEQEREDLQEIKKIVKEFSFICEETCDLKEQGFERDFITLRIEIENAKFFLESIKYEILKEEISEENITKQNETIEAEGNATFSLIQHQAKINEPVKWTKEIKFQNKTESPKFELPEQASNISVFKIISEEKTKLDDEKIIIN